jgi:hypothetical protein
MRGLQSRHERWLNAMQEVHDRSGRTDTAQIRTVYQPADRSRQAIGYVRQNLQQINGFPSSQKVTSVILHKRRQSLMRLPEFVRR